MSRQEEQRYHLAHTIQRRRIGFARRHILHHVEAAYMIAYSASLCLWVSSAFYCEIGSLIRPLGRGNQGAATNYVLGPWGDGSSCGIELGEGGSRVVGVTVRVLGQVEGGTLVPCQRDTVLDAQWQVGLGSKQVRTWFASDRWRRESLHWQCNDVRRQLSHPICLPFPPQSQGYTHRQR